MVITGTASSDNLIGTNGIDSISGGSGGDLLDGGSGNDEMYGEAGNDSYVIRDLFDHVFDSSGNDSAVIHVNFYKTNSSVENWTWANGVQRLPYWIDSLLPGISTAFPAYLGADRTVFYSFPATAPAYFTAADATGYEGFTTQQKALAKQALDYIASIVNLKFVETNNPSQANTIVFGNNAQSGSSAYAYFPDDGDYLGSDVLMNADTDNLYPAVGKESALILIHELGHAFGLKHPFSGGSGEGPFLPRHQDWSEQTVMSYETYPYTYDLSFAPLDVAALQYLYGPSTAVVRDDTYTLDPHKPNFIWDGAGTDTVDGSALSQDLTLYLEPGYWSHVGAQATQIYGGGQVTINFGTVIESAKGGAAGDRIFGNIADNRIWGHGGNDIISDHGGNDVVDCGPGNDIVQGLWGRDVLLGSHGEDRLVLQQKVSEMQIIRLRDDAFVVTDASATNIGLCRGMELLQFSDGLVGVSDVPFAARHDTGLAQLYLAAYGRAATQADYRYWSAAAQERGLFAVANEMFSQAEVQTVYSSGMTSEAFVSSIYSNVFGRPADPGGLAFWSNHLKTMSRGEVVLHMINGVMHEADGTTGKDFFQNRVDWSLYALDYQARHGVDLAAGQLPSLTAGVDADTADLVTLIAQAQSGALF